MRKLIRSFGLLFFILIICGCERSSDSYNYNNGNGYDNGGRSITVSVENQSPYEILVYKGDAQYARLSSGSSIGVYGYLVGDQELYVSVVTPVFYKTEDFDRFDSYSTFVVYAEGTSRNTEHY